MMFVTVQNFNSMSQKHFPKKIDRLSSEDSLPNSSRLSLFMRSTLLALLFLSLTWLCSLNYGTVATLFSNSVESDRPELLLPLLLNDLEKEGLFNLGDKALFLNGEDTVSSYSQDTEMATFDLVSTGRKLLSIKEEEAKKKALRKLEDVLLEPPRAASRKSRTYFKRTRYLPNLMGDNLNLERYSRRVFIDVSNGKGSDGMKWFVENYPTRNQKFEMYKIETVNDEMSLGSEKMGMTEWLKENVKEEEYVVMKAEAEVVEEMMRSKSIKMVDELFLECKPKGLGKREMKSKSGRAYWECLALYGKLRDEGVAVHQWWG